MKMPEKCTFSDNLELTKLGYTNPNYLEEIRNEKTIYLQLHLFNCQCSCFLNMSIQKNVIARFPQYSGKPRYLKLPIFNGYYCLSAEFQGIKY